MREERKELNISPLLPRLHVVATHNTEEFIYAHINHHLQELGIEGVTAQDLVDAVMDYVELGYGYSTEKEIGQQRWTNYTLVVVITLGVCFIETILEVMSSTGVSLDPEFCVKAVRGMLCEMKQNPDRFAGKRVLFLHSGLCSQDYNTD